MNEKRPSAEFIELLLSYINSEDEDELYQASELGHRLVQQEVGPEELVAIHLEAMQTLMGQIPLTQVPVLLMKSHNLLLEAMMAYSLAYRDYLQAAWSRAELLEQKVLERTRDLNERNAELEETRTEILERLVLISEFRDDETHQHTLRVARSSALLARELGVADEEVELIQRAAPLHDIGKIGIPDRILLKPGKLTLQEFAHVKTHTYIGARILAGGRTPMIRMAAQIALAHHERWDGSGYPNGLEGEAIPFASRIVSVADVFDALVNKRHYKPAWPIEAAMAEISAQQGHQFDPQVVDALQVVQARHDLLAPIAAVRR